LSFALAFAGMIIGSLLSQGPADAKTPQMEAVV
jgi:hypothetical protein